jgi:hypothetical protein
MMSVRSEDPVLRNARREALLVVGIWLTAVVYSLSVCYRFGYGRDAATLTYVLGFPDWIFWGVVLPWCVCTALSFVLSSFVITDDDLGEELPEESLASGANPARGEPDHA